MTSDNEMNNQAAQTMPERRTFTDAEIREWMERHDLEGMGLTDARAAIEDAQSMDMLAAAPAASGGEDAVGCTCGACPLPAGCKIGDCMRGLDNTPEESATPSAASVSERARHGVVRATVRVTDEDDVLHIECRFDDGQKYAAIETSGHRCEELAGFIVSALEQALTQQRGDGEAVDRDAWAEALELPQGYTVEEFLPGGWHYAWTRADGERMVSGTTWNHPALAAIAAWQYAPATTPQPSAEGLRDLAQRWRARADEKERALSHSAGILAYDDCADELESLLARGG